MSPNFCNTKKLKISAIDKFVRQDCRPSLSNASFTQKYKNFSLPAENFCKASLSLQILQKFRPHRKNPLYGNKTLK